MLLYEGLEEECCFMRDWRRNVVLCGIGGGMLWDGRGLLLDGRGNVVPIFRFFD